MSIVDEGTVSFWCRHEHPDWTSNFDNYDFGTLEIQQMKFKAAKHPDCYIELDIEGPLGVHRNVSLPIPACDALGLNVAIVWKRPEVIIYLNGQRAQTITV